MSMLLDSALRRRWYAQDQFAPLGNALGLSMAWMLHTDYDLFVARRTRIVHRRVGHLPV